MNSQTTAHALYLDHQKTLIRTLLRMVGCRQTAEDLAQEAYARLLGATEQQDIRHPAPFLFQTARNLAIDHLRRQQIRNRTEAVLDDPDVLDTVPGNSVPPERAVSAIQQTSMALDVLRKMPERRQAIFVMHRLHGCTYEEIAERMGISRSGVEKQLQRAMLQLIEAGVSDD